MADKYNDWTPQAGNFTPATAAQKDLGTAHPATQSFWEKLNPANPDGYLANATAPGSTGEALIRGATQGATLGLGNKAQALIRSAVPGNPTYAELRDQGTAANENASNAHPVAYGAGVLAGSIPSALAVGSGGLAAVKAMPATASTAAKVAAGAAGAGAGGAAVGTVQGLGAPEPTAGSVAKSAAINGGLSALGGGLAQKFAPLKAAVTPAPVAAKAAQGSSEMMGHLWTPEAQRVFATLEPRLQEKFMEGSLTAAESAELPAVLGEIADNFKQPSMMISEMQSKAALAAQKAQASANAEANAAKAGAVAQTALPLSGAATGVLFPGVMPGTTKVNPDDPVLDQALQYGKNAIIGGTEAKLGAMAPQIGKAAIPFAGAVGSDVSNVVNGNTTPGTEPFTGDKTTPATEYPSEPYTPVDTKKYQDETPVDQKTSSNTKGGFGAIANFLAQAQQSSNPAVIAAAQAAQSQVDPSDPDQARKIAMALQSTPEGRAVGNSDSSLNA